MAVRDIGNLMQVDERQTINFNKDIIMTDLSGNSVVVCKCFCTIVSYKSISYYMEVLEEGVFKSQKELIQIEIDKFKTEAYMIATNNNVPII